MPTSATEWAQRWLDALRKRDTDVLGSLTAYPFRFDDTGAVVGCKAGAAANREQLSAAVVCLLENELLSGALKANPELFYQSKTLRDLPRWARRWRKEFRADDSVIATELGDNGISYFFVLSVSAEGVRAVFRHAEFWPN